MMQTNHMHKHKFAFSLLKADSFIFKCSDRGCFKFQPTLFPILFKQWSVSVEALSADSCPSFSISMRDKKSRTHSLIVEQYTRTAFSEAYDDISTEDL